MYRTPAITLLLASVLLSLLLPATAVRLPRPQLVVSLEADAAATDLTRFLTNPRQSGGRHLAQVPAPAPATAPLTPLNQSLALAPLFTATVIDVLKPQYHITPLQGWSNDPNGMLEWQGLYHVFFQAQPLEVVWGSPYWAHVVSDDLVHWKRLPDAIIPDTSFDYDGVFSGSASFLPDGTPIQFFTGVTRWKELGWFYQVQAAAVPATYTPGPRGGFDVQLARWRKLDNVTIGFPLPPGGNHSNFRDPTTAWSEAGAANSTTYYMGVGAQVYCAGSAALYTSQDMVHWDYLGILFGQSYSNDPNNYCAPSNGTCDQYGGACHTWETPDFFEIAPGVWGFTYGDQVNGRNPFGANWYILGNEPLDYEAAANGGSAFQDIYNGEVYSPRLIDYGTIYASKSFPLSDGRRAWMGWVFETQVGCLEMCSPATPIIVKQGYQGVQTLAREVTLDQELGQLVYYPVVETARLRTALLYNSSVDFASVASATAAPPPSAGQQPGETVILPEGRATPAGSDGNRQIEVLANFRLAATNGSLPQGATFRVGAVLLTGNGTRTTFLLNGTSASQAGRVVVSNVTMLTDPSLAGGATNTTLLQGGPVSVRNGTDMLELRIFVDRSLLEYYALQGLGVTTSRIYPVGFGTDWGLALFGSLAGPAGAPAGSVSAQASVWALGAAWVDTVQGQEVQYMGPVAV